MLRRVLSIAGVLIALTLAVLSCTLSYRFAHQLGGTPLEASAYGLAAVAIDLLKCLMPFFIVERAREGRWLAAAGAGLIVLIGVSWSFTSAMGLAAQNRLARAATIESRQAELADTLAEIRRLEARRLAGSERRSTREIEAEIQERLATVVTVGQQARTVAALSDGCKRPTRATAEACNGVSALRTQLAVAEEEGRRTQRLEMLRERAIALRKGGAGEGTPADVQAHFIGRAIAAGGATASIGLIQLVLVAFVALVLEVGSSLGLYVALGTHRPPQSNQGPTAGDVLQYCVERFQPRPQAALPMAEAFQDYAAWCARTGVAPLPPDRFHAALVRIAAEQQVTRSRDCLHHIALGDAPVGNGDSAAPAASPDEVEKIHGKG